MERGESIDELMAKSKDISTVSYDFMIARNSIPVNDKLAIGLLGMYDCSSGGAFKNVNLSVSGAYHKSLNENGNSSLALGFQSTFASRKITFEGLHFASQFTSGGFNANLPSNETGLVSTKNYLDMNVGLLYSFVNENDEIHKT